MTDTETARKHCATTSANTFKPGPLNKVKELSIFSCNRNESQSCPSQTSVFKEKEGWEITTLTCTLIGRRSHQKKKTCRTCPHGHIANCCAYLPTNQPLSKHRQGHQPSPCTTTAPCEQQGEPIKAPLHPIQASTLNIPRSSRPYATLVHRHMYISSARCPQQPIIR